MTEIPDFIRRAMEAQGKFDPDETMDREVAPALPSDTTGTKCAACGAQVRPGDRALLHEVTGWARPRKAGGQNHVIARQETGRVMCGPCGLKLRSGVAPEQGTLV